VASRLSPGCDLLYKDNRKVMGGYVLPL
jgi:hypothetical protein